MTESLPLLPEAPSPRRCRCGRPVPKGRLIEGWGSGCAVEYGVTPAPTPRVTTVRQEGESLLDLLTGDTAGVGDGGRVAECSELRGGGESVSDMIEWLNGVLDRREAVANAAADYGPEWRYSGSAVYPSDENRHPGAIVTGSYGDLEEQYGEHIALNDPKQTLDDVAADRAILAAHQRDETSGECVTCCVDGSYAQQDWPCETVRLVASRYTAWPGYRTEWAPEANRG